MFSKQILSISILICTLLNWPSAIAADGAPTYAGLEFYGSSQMSRDEIESALHLRPGASVKSVDAAIARLKQKIEKRRLAANVEMVSDGPDRIVVAVDFENLIGEGIPVRTLKHPHHVIVKSDKPELLLLNLRNRLQRLDDEGRHWTDSYEDGTRRFSDEPAEQIVYEIRRFGPVLRDQWLEIVESDPDYMRRCEAIELLNWAGHSIETCARLIPALDDSHYQVRASVDKFIFPRLSSLPDGFPFDQLGEALVRQLKRPSHQDRSKAMYFILALIKKQPQLNAPFKQACQKDIEKFAQESQIQSIRKVANELLALFRVPPPRPRPEKVPEPGF